MVDRGRTSIKRGKDLYTKGWEVENRGDSATLWCASSRAWKKVENSRVSDEKLLVARNDKKCWKIHERMWLMSENEEQAGGTSGKIKVEWDTGKTIDVSNSKLHYKVASNSREGYYSSSLW